MMTTKPSKQHGWLKQLVGDWTCVAESVMEPGKPAARHKIREKVRTVGDLWIVADGRGEMPGGGTAIMMLTLGYDPARKRFVGSWVGSMMTHMWVYEGKLDRSGKVLTLNTTGPAMSGKGTAAYRDVITITGKGERTLTSSGRGKGGKWTTFMTATYTRRK